MNSFLFFCDRNKQTCSIPTKGHSKIVLLALSVEGQKHEGFPNFFWYILYLGIHLQLNTLKNGLGQILFAGTVSFNSLSGVFSGS